ncbi:hypothetical protein [Microbispora sp. ATCC PTA-5024]|uniref:hypothetical protein n=1 Tax=Microbispora sp. ATCC PTA-5024 TaxID=316330 RepID=UPI0003DDCBA6|nr:hypothetical protein [Microbispora sp. ATCC PTA-5024]ETK32160.1 hypothetical protein MPTA5024_31325 [Microbispora sp. ATCC PTA-5024]
MKVAQARAAAAGWVAEHAAGTAGFAGAFLSGSAVWLPDEAELPPASDVDVTVVTAGATAPPKLGKVPWNGVLVEVTYTTWDAIGPPDAVLGSYHLAGCFRADTIVADPTGRLTALRAAVSAEHPRRVWVRRRCRDAELRIADGLRTLSAALPLHDRVTAWLFPTGVTAHVVLTAGLRNPTVRLRYAAARDLLAEYGRLDRYEELLDLLGCAGMTASGAARHLRAMTEVFDAAVPTARTPFPFSSDITAAARPVAVDGGRALIEGGRHREAVFWIAATYARCLKILSADAPAAAAAHRPAFEDLLADLGVARPADLERRARRLLGLLPRLRALAEEIVAANPDVRD